MARGSRGKGLLSAGALAVILVACAGEPAGPTPASAGPGDAANGRVVYEMKCMSCHTVGAGDRIGPDLRGVTARRSREWLVKWIKDPLGMGRDDPDGRALVARFKNVPMPPANLTDGQIDDVLAHLKADADRAGVPSGPAKASH